VRRWVSVTHRLGCVLCLFLETLDSTGSAISLLVCTGLENGTLTLYGLRSDSVSHVLSFSGPLKKKNRKGPSLTSLAGLPYVLSQCIT